MEISKSFYHRFSFFRRFCCYLSGTRSLESSLDNLPLECLQLIISYVHFRYWPQLELVNRRLRAGVLATWSMMKEAHLGYCGRKVILGKMPRKEALQALLRMVFARSPHVRSISGFSLLIWSHDLGRCGKMRLDSEIMMQVAAFPRLRSITFADCEIRIKDLAIFLAQSKSRAILEELCIFNRNADIIVTDEEEEDEDEEMVRHALTDVKPTIELTAFRLRWNRFFPSSFLALNASRLQVFSVIGHSFPAAAITELLSRCVRLKELRIDFVGAKDDWITTISAGLKAMPSRELRRFGLAGWKTTGEVAEMLTQLANKYPNLELLDLPSWWRVPNLMADERILDVIGHRFNMLEELHLDIVGFSEESITEFLGRMVQLKRLSLTYHDGQCGVSTRVVSAVASNLKDLSKLHLDVRSISSDDATMLLHLEMLKELSIRFGSDSQRYVSVCQQLAPILVSVCLHCFMNIDEQLLISAIGKGVMGIRRLSLRCAAITDVSLDAIADSCPFMEELDITGCGGVTGDGVKRIIERCKKLKCVKVHRGMDNIKGLVKDGPVFLQDTTGDSDDEMKWWSW